MKQKIIILFVLTSLTMVTILYAMRPREIVMMTQKQYDLIESMNPDLLDFTFFQVKHNQGLIKRVITRIEAIHDQQVKDQNNFVSWLDRIGFSSSSTMKDLHDVTADKLLSNYGIVLDSDAFDEFYDKYLQNDGDLMHLIDTDETLMLAAFYHGMMEQFQKSKVYDLNSLTLLELYLMQENENFLDISREIIESEINGGLEALTTTT